MNIDRIAREMVDVEPSVDLEARIRASVRRSEARPIRTAKWWLWTVGAPLAASAALGVAAVKFVGVQETRSPGGVTSAGVRGASGPGAETPIGVKGTRTQLAASTVSSSTSPLPKIHTSKLSARASRLSPDELAWMERRLPALDAVGALRMEHLPVDWIQPEPLAITPLTMTPVGTDGAGIERRDER